MTDRRDTNERFRAGQLLRFFVGETDTHTQTNGQTERQTHIETDRSEI